MAEPRIVLHHKYITGFDVKGFIDEVNRVFNEDMRALDLRLKLQTTEYDGLAEAIGLASSGILSILGAARGILVDGRASKKSAARAANLITSCIESIRPFNDGWTVPGKRMPNTKRRDESVSVEIARGTDGVWTSGKPQ